MGLNPLSAHRVRSVDAYPGPRAGFDVVRAELPDGARSTLHIARYDRVAASARIVVFDEPTPLIRWCRDNGAHDAVVGGFFLRSEAVPLGYVRVGGQARPTVAFDAPWDQRRACVHVCGGELRVAPRDRIGHDATGDLLQAGPLLVAEGRSMVHDGHDPEGFSAGAHQFDSDITAGRYPRAALAVTRTQVLAAACDGRSPDDAGMTLAEFAQALVGLGATDALNLDGGGSATLVHAGRLRNRPREVDGTDLYEGRPILTAIAFQAY